MTLFFSGCVAEPQKPILQTVPSGRLDWAGELPVVHLYGTPYEMGYQQGSLLRDPARASVEAFLGFGDAALGIALAGKVFARRKLDDAWEEMEPSVPQSYLDEMEGLADGTGLPLQLIHRVHALSELTAVSGAGFAAAGPATREGRLVHLRNLDWALPAEVRRYSALIVRHPRKGNTSVTVGWLGFTGAVSGISDQGISVSETDTGTMEEELKGTPMPFLLRAVLDEAKDLEQAVEIVKAAPRTGGYTYLFADAKRSKAVLLETTRAECTAAWMGAESTLRLAGEEEVLEGSPKLSPDAAQSLVYAYPEMRLGDLQGRGSGEEGSAQVNLKQLFDGAVGGT